MHSAIRLSALLCVCKWAVGATLPFSRIVVFGDSYSDTGTAYALSDGAIPGPGYYQNKYASDGPIWPTRLAEALGVELSGWAVAGSTVDSTAIYSPGSSIVLPGVRQQVAHYLGNATERARIDSSLHIFLCGGINELVISPTIRAADVAARLSLIVRDLTEAGATMFVLGVEPALRSLPFMQTASPKRLEAHDHYAAEYKAHMIAIRAALSDKATAGIVDLRGVFEAIESDGPAWGFDQAAVRPPVACAHGLGMGASGPITSCADPASYLFHDTVHPTTTGHAVIAKTFLTTILNDFAL